VLVLAHDDSTRRMLENRLTQSGFRVLAAATGAEARRHISQDAPDVVVLDASLLSGVEVVATLRATPALKRVPVLAVTNANTGAMALRALVR
jgi:two-component system KDP operon response regulator KdpE